jgi:hypothetical protein
MFHDHLLKLKIHITTIELLLILGTKLYEKNNITNK